LITVWIAANNWDSMPAIRFSASPETRFAATIQRQVQKQLVVANRTSDVEVEDVPLELLENKVPRVETSTGSIESRKPEFENQNRAHCANHFRGAVNDPRASVRSVESETKHSGSRTGGDHTQP
jgi:hypothetical protein